MEYADVPRSKLADWSDDEASSLKDTSSKWDKVVILKHMFTLQELEVRFSLSILPSATSHLTARTGPINAPF